MAARKQETSPADFVPKNLTLASLQKAAGRCRGCDLYLRATQTVFGKGSVGARIVLIGEQPGDKEDLEGEPFVGPAGKLLNRALEDAGIARTDAYVTNAVKHFKWEARGKRRIHEKPTATEIAACRPWLDAELKVVRPRVVVCLGASAAQSLLGRDLKVTQRRGERIDGRSVALSIEAWIVFDRASVIDIARPGWGHPPSRIRVIRE
ncbi:MAG: UdgX family uracil-DNA binding protein [Acidobacteriaceae bacterium]